MSVIPIEDWRANWTPTKPSKLPADPLRPVIKRDALILYRTTNAEDGTNRGGENANNPGLNRLARKTGISVRVLYRIVNGETKNVEVSIADQYLCATGRHLRDLWPWYYDEASA